MARKADPNKKSQIIDAATLVFARKGFAGTIMAQVADAAGTGKGTLYEYFKSKEDLFFAVFERVIAEASAHVTSHVNNTNDSAAARLKKLSADLIQTWMAQLEMYALVMEFWSASATLSGRHMFKAAFKAGYTEFRQQMSALIQEGVARGEFSSDIDPHKIGAVVIGSWDALLLQAWLDPDFDPLAASHEHMRVLLKGMTA